MKLIILFSLLLMSAVGYSQDCLKYLNQNSSFLKNDLGENIEITFLPDQNAYSFEQHGTTFILLMDDDLQKCESVGYAVDILNILDEIQILKDIGWQEIKVDHNGWMFAKDNRMCVATLSPVDDYYMIYFF